MAAKVYAVCNQKGGCAKTVTSVNLGIGLAREGKRVLLVDVDAQGSLTASLGYRQPDQIEITLATLLAEKKATPMIQIPKHRELSRRIAELTEELEELRSEKALLLQSLQYTADTGVDVIRKNIATMEVGLKRLEQQEQKYTAELDNALKEYTELQEQAAEFDPDELMSEHLAIRPDKERSAVSRVQSAYGDRYQPLMMYDSKRDVSEMLGEETEVRSIRERLRQKQQTQTQQHKKPKRHEQER